MRPSLEVDLAPGLRLSHPVVAASGCLGTGRGVPGLVDLHRLGAVVTRSLTLSPSRGGATPRAAETASGFLWSAGLQNPGVEEFVEVDLPQLSRFKTPVIASIAGSTLDEYIRVASWLHVRPGIAALEVYLGTPDQERRGDPFFSHLERIREVVGAVARLSRVPVFVKLPMLVPDLVATARTCVRDGAVGLTLIDSPPGLAVDAGRLRSKLAAPVGGLSGPAVKPVALAAVYQVARALPEVPIMGVGGIATGEDAVEFLLVGAWAVQVGTAMLVNPSAPVEIARGISTYLQDKGLGSPREVRGRIRVRGGGEPGDLEPPVPRPEAVR